MGEIRDHLFGTLAIRGHFVTEAQVEEAIAEQQLFEQTGQPVPPLGEVLVQKGYMTTEQVKAVLQGQTNRKAKFGEIAVQWKLCSQASVQAALAFQTEVRARGEAVPRIGEILVTRALIKSHQVHAILQTQGKSIVRCPNCKTRYNVTGLMPGGKLNCGRCKKDFSAVPEAPPVVENGSAKELGSDLTQQLPAVTIDERTGPQMIGPYQIQTRLGADHSGVLYKACDPATKQLVAIRVLSEAIMQGADDFERWVAAGQTAAELDHPNLQRILTMGSENSRAYLVMEFIEGQSLRQRLRDRGALPLLESLDILIQVAEALAYGHAHDLIHGDMHPRHVLIGKDKRVRLGNLGTPKKIIQDLRLMAQVSGSLPLYAAPEVLIDESEADERSDLYGLCALGYHLFTGKPPLEGRDLLQAGFMAASGNIAPAQTLVPALPAYVNRVLLKGLSSEPDERYETADALLADLRKCRAGVMVQAADIPDVAPIAVRPEAPRRAVRMRQRYRPGDRRKGTYILRKPKTAGPLRPVGAAPSRVGSAVQAALVRTGSASRLQPAAPSSRPNLPAIGSGGITAPRPVPKRRLRNAVDAARSQFHDLSPFAKAMCLLLPIMLGGLITWAIFALRPEPPPVEESTVQLENLRKPDETEKISDAERKARNEYNVVLDFARKNASDHAGVVRQIDQLLVRNSAVDPNSKTMTDARKLREEFSKAGAQYSQEPLRKKLEQLTESYNFREAADELGRWGKLWGTDVAGETAKELAAWLAQREKTMAEELLAKSARLCGEKDFKGARAACQTIQDHFAREYASKALTERMAVDEAEQKAGINAAAEKERERQKQLTEMREAQAPERYGKLLQRLVPLIARFDTEAALAEIERDTTEFTGTSVGPKFQSLKVDMARLKKLRERLVDEARKGKLAEMKIDYHQELYPFNDAAPQGPVLATRNVRVETRWHEFDLPALMEMVTRITDITNGEQVLDQAVFRLYAGQLKEAETFLGKADKLAAVTQSYVEQLAERVKMAPPPPIQTVTEPAKETEQDPAVVLAFKALGYEIAQGVWSMTPERAMSGVPSGKDPQGNPSRLISVRRSVPPFKTLSVEVRGEGESVGFSFGKGKRWMVAPTAEWQQIMLKVDSVTGRSLLSVNGQPKVSLEALEGDAAKDLGDVVYLRALGKRIEFRNLAIDDQVSGGGPGPVAKPAQDPAAAQALKLLGWDIVGGVWSIEGENHFAALPEDVHHEVGVKRDLATCRAISVEVRGKGDSAGFSFGIGKRFVIKPTDEWRRLTLEINDGGKPKLILNGQAIKSLEDVSKVVSADLTGAFGLRGVGSRIEFRNFRFE